jgi:hypothetical protein
MSDEDDGYTTPTESSVRDKVGVLKQGTPERLTSREFELATPGTKRQYLRRRRGALNRKKERMAKEKAKRIERAVKVKSKNKLAADARKHGLQLLSDALVGDPSVLKGKKIVICPSSFYTKFNSMVSVGCSRTSSFIDPYVTARRTKKAKCANFTGELKFLSKDTWNMTKNLPRDFFILNPRVLDTHEKETEKLDKWLSPYRKWGEFLKIVPKTVESSDAAKVTKFQILTECEEFFQIPYSYILGDKSDPLREDISLHIELIIAEPDKCFWFFLAKLVNIPVSNKLAFFAILMTFSKSIASRYTSVLKHFKNDGVFEPVDENDGVFEPVDENQWPHKVVKDNITVEKLLKHPLARRLCVRRVYRSLTPTYGEILPRHLIYQIAREQCMAEFSEIVNQLGPLPEENEAPKEVEEASWEQLALSDVEVEKAEDTETEEEDYNY